MAKILVVEDTPTQAAMVKIGLKRHGHEVLVLDHALVARVAPGQPDALRRWGDADPGAYVVVALGQRQIRRRVGRIQSSHVGRECVAFAHS